MSQKILLILAFCVIIGGGAAAIFYAREQTQDAPIVEQTPLEQNAGDPKVVGENVSFTITEADHKRWEILAQKAYYYPDRKGAKLQGMTGKLFGDSGEATATFTAPTGELNQEIKSILLTGGVTVQSTDGESTLQAPLMKWSPSSKNVEAEGGIHLTKKGFGKSTADKCLFSMDFSFIALEGNAQSEMDL